MRVSAFFCLALALGACGGPSQSSTTPMGFTRAPRGPEPVVLTLRTSDDRVLEIADQQGSPVLLFLFATYDDASIATLREVSRFARDALDTVVVGVTVQPDAAVFARQFAETQSPPFAVAFDPADRILRGTTDLGAVEVVPTVVMIDAHGVECGRHVGYTSLAHLEAMHEEALQRGGVVAPVTPDAPHASPATTEPEPPPGDLVIEPDGTERVIAPDAQP